MANEAGAGCSVRGSTIDNYTFVSQAFPASQAGNVSRLAFYKSSVAADPINFAFFTASGDSLTTVSGTRISGLTAATGAACAEFNSPGDFSEFAVSSGDYLGCYSSDDMSYKTSTGSGIWYKSGDQTNVSGVSFTDSSSGIDSLTADITGGGGLTINLDDTITISDSISLNLIKSFSDSISMSDIISKRPEIILSDTINMSDQINTLIALTLSLSDTITMSDSVSKQPGIVKADTITMSDTFSKVSEFVRTFSDQIDMSDQISKDIGITKADIITLSDTFSTSEEVIYALVNFLAKDRVFNFTAKNKTFNFTAKNKNFNFGADPRGKKP